MRLYFLLSLGLLCKVWLCSAQNLVLNPSFEEYTKCPDDGGQIYYCPYWYDVNKHYVNYYHYCSPNGYKPRKPPRTGSAIAGITGLSSLGELMFNDLRTYAEGILSKTLHKDSFYYVEFYVQLSEIYRRECHIANLGLYFSNEFLDFKLNEAELLPYKPQIQNYPLKLLGDTNNWMWVSGIYIAREMKSLLL